MMRQAIDLLADDPATTVLVLISKPPDAAIAELIYERLHNLSKPVVTCFLNAEPAPARRVGAHPATTLDEAAALAIHLAAQPSARAGTPPPRAAPTGAALEAFCRARSRAGGRGASHAGRRGRPPRPQPAVRAGPLRRRHPRLRSAGHPPPAPRCRLERAPGRGPAAADPRRSVGHTVLDLGADEFTVGRPHPMIDGSLRAERLLAEADDPATAVLLLDVILGYGAHPDPAGALVPTLATARARAAAAGRYLPVVVLRARHRRRPAGPRPARGDAPRRWRPRLPDQRASRARRRGHRPARCAGAQVG